MKRAVFLILAGLVSGCTQGVQPDKAQLSAGVPSPPVTASPSEGKPEWLSLFKPLPEVASGSPEMVELGRMLYYDKRLSKSGTVSCNSCHALDRYGVDGQPTSPGFEGQRGGRNSPTVYNAYLHIAQFWDGRAPDVEAQAQGPVLNPVEMGMASEAAVTEVLKTVPEYRRRFAELFPQEKEPLTLRNAALAIAAFERGLVTPSRFDDYLSGDDQALTQEELAGARIFVETGCASCHSGPAMGGSSFQKLGLKQPYPDKDPGRMNVTGKETDRAKFKVPSLRNVTETGPYFHNGQVTTLEEAVLLMGRHQLGKELSPQEVSAIITFLGTLKGELPTDYITPPALPRSDATTPGPSGDGV